MSNTNSDLKKRAGSPSLLPGASKRGAHSLFVTSPSSEALSPSNVIETRHDEANTSIHDNRSDSGVQRYGKGSSGPDVQMLISEAATDAVAAADTAGEDFDVEMPPDGNQNPDCAPLSKRFHPLIGNILQFLDQSVIFTLMFVCRYWRLALRIVPINVVAGESFSFDP